MKQDLNKEIEITAKALAEFEAELSDIPNKTVLATADADAVSLINLRVKQSELPVQIQMHQVRLHQLLLKRDESELPEAEAEIEETFQPVEQARQRFDEATKELSIASATHQDALERKRELQRSIADRKRLIERLMHQQTNRPASSLSAHFG